MKKIELDKLTIELIASNIVLLTLKNSVIIDSNDVIEVKKNNLILTEGRDYAIVLDSGRYTSVTKNAREAMVSDSIQLNRKASAFVINSLSQRLLGNFYLQINKPSVPTKLFSNKKEAITWAKDMLSNP